MSLTRLSRLARLALPLLAWAALLPAARAGNGTGELKPVAADTLKGLSAPAATPLARALEKHKGKAVLLNLWATWCPPCREEMPALQELADGYAGRPFVLLTVAVGDRRRDVEDFLWERGLTPEVVLDPERDILRALGVRVLPTSFLLDARHRPRWRVVGPLGWEGAAARAAVERLIPKSPH